MQAAYVREIIAMPEVTAVPERRPQDRGVINLRGRVIPLIDMRKQFGWRSVPEELEDFYGLMNQREQDHRHWLTELERSAREGAEFRLATDPHQCAFGKWYYAYRPESPWIAALLRRFEQPHSRIHALASTVLHLAQAGKHEEVHRLLEQARNGELREMISLFERLKTLMEESARELAMVIATAGKTFAVSIDHAVAVENIPPESIKEIETGALPGGRGRARKVAHRAAANSFAVILDPDMFDVSAA